MEFQIARIERVVKTTLRDWTCWFVVRPAEGLFRASRRGRLDISFVELPCGVMLNSKRDPWYLPG
jgi:hypothetical protein